MKKTNKSSLIAFLTAIALSPLAMASTYSSPDNGYQAGMGTRAGSSDDRHRHHHRHDHHRHDHHRHHERDHHYHPKKRICTKRVRNACNPRCLKNPLLNPANCCRKVVEEQCTVR